MRCDYCGWVNEDGRTRCVKCNQLLPEQNTTNIPNETEQIGNNTNTESDDCKFCTSCGYPIATDVANCPACNAPVVQPVANPALNTKATIRDVSVAGATLNMMRTPLNENFSAKMKQTVRDGIVAAELANNPINDKIQQQDTSNVDDLKKTVLNVNIEQSDSNLSKKASIEKHSRCMFTALEGFENARNIISIDSIPGKLGRNEIEPENISIEKVHIGIECENGKWYIENFSPNGNTYIRVNRKMELIDGDIIVIGNKKYIFTKG